LSRGGKKYRVSLASMLHSSVIEPLGTAGDLGLDHQAFIHQLLGRFI
jgi:hypothetical protein